TPSSSMSPASSPSTGRTVSPRTGSTRTGSSWKRFVTLPKNASRPQKGVRMAGKVLVNLATGMEDPERVTVAFLVATAALDQGKTVVVWATKDAVRLALPGEAAGEACTGCPPLERLFQQFT